jgi:hypothetical protein
VKWLHHSQVLIVATCEAIRDLLEMMMLLEMCEKFETQNLVNELVDAFSILKSNLKLPFFLFLATLLFYFLLIILNH